LSYAIAVQVSWKPHSRADFAYKNMKRVWKGEKPQAVAIDYDL